MLSLDLDGNDSTATGLGYQATFTENGAGVPVVDADRAIAQHAALGTNLGAATVTLTNAQAGDRLLVGGSAATSGTISGVSYSITSAGGGIEIAFSGTASAATYQSILSQITYDNTTENPSTTDRQIEVSVTNTTFGTTSNVAVSTIHVVPVNDAPVGVNDTIPVSEDTTITLDVLGNDTDGDGDPLTITSAAIDTNGDGTPDPLVLGAPTAMVTSTGAAIGVITVAANGDVTFAPAQNYTGPVPSLTYTPNDGTVDGTPATDTFGPIIAVPEAPLGSDGTITVPEDSTYTITVADFGFSDPDGDAFDHVEITTLPANGTLLLNGVPVSAGDEISVSDITSGLLTFVPVANANGSPYASFQFVVCDDSAPSLFTETFGAGTGRASFATAGLTGTTTYVYDGSGAIDDGDYALVSGIDPSLGSWWNTTNFSTYDYSQTDHTGDPNGRFMIVNASFGAGEFYRQGVTITQGGDYQVSVALANGNSYTVKPNVTISILDASNAVVATINTGDLSDYTSANNWQTYALSATLAPGSYSFVLVNNAPGGFGNDLYVDDIVFAANPPSCDPTPNTMTFNVSPVNDAPVATDDTNTVSEDGPAATGDVTPGTLGQDSDLDGDTLTVTQVNGAAFTPGTAITLPSGALLTMNADGTYSYDPTGAFEGLGVGDTGSDSFTYQISDGNGGFDTATVTLTANGVNDAPVAIADINSGTEQQTLSGDVISGAVTAGGGTGGTDTDIDGDPLTVTALNLGSVGSPIILTHGTLTIQADGSYTFVPNATANALDQGQVVNEQVTYTISDGNGGTAQATLTLTLTGENDAPFNALAIPQTNTNDGGNVSIPTFGAFHDPDGEPLTFTLDATAPSWLSIDPATGAITGTPPADASQGTNTANPGEYLITITATDPDGAAVTTTVTLTITNLPPVAHDDVGAVDRGAPVTLVVLANDEDGGRDSDGLTVVWAEARNGEVVVNTDGTLTYIPELGFEGDEVITYRISDGNGGFAEAVVRLTVTADFVANSETPTSESHETIEYYMSGPITADGQVLDTVQALDGRVADAWLSGNAGEETLYDVSGLTSFSLKLETSAQLDGVMVETFTRDGQLILNFAYEGTGSMTGAVEWKVQQVDGRPLPEWLEWVDNGHLLGRHPANIEWIDLRVTALLPDETTILHEVRVNTKTGELQPLTVGRAGMNTPPALWESLQPIRKLTDAQIQSLGWRLAS